MRKKVKGGNGAQWFEAKKNHQGLKMHLALIVQVAIVAHCGQITKLQKNI